MGSESLLLRMLEPMVRPPGTTSPKTQAKLPMEQQSFEQMLAQIPGAEAFSEENSERISGGISGGETGISSEVSAGGTSGGASGGGVTHSEQALMAQLGSVDRIENAALRTMLNELSTKQEK